VVVIVTERYYDDGTEPTVLPHLNQRQVCRGVGCQQGRKVCPHPDECEDDSTGLERAAVFLVVMASCAAVIGFLAGLLS
jgi:hypothetical protein